MGGTDEDLLAAIRFVFFRFMGYVPDDKMLVNAIRDWHDEPLKSTCSICGNPTDYSKWTCETCADPLGGDSEDD